MNSPFSFVRYPIQRKQSTMSIVPLSGTQRNNLASVANFLLKSASQLTPKEAKSLASGLYNLAQDGLTTYKEDRVIKGLAETRELLREVDEDKKISKAFLNRPTPRPLVLRPRRKGNIPKSRSKNKGGLTNISAAPAAFGSIYRGLPTTFGNAKSIPNEGPGLRVIGQHIVSANVMADGFTGIFYAGGVTTNSNFSMNPSDTTTIGGSHLETYSTLFDKFRFRKFCVYYVPSVGSDTIGSFAMGYCRDPEESTAPSFSTMPNLSPSLLVPYWQAASLEVDCTRGDETYYCRNASGSAAGPNARMTIQGVVHGQHSTSGSGANVQYGYFILRYVCDFYSPCAT